MPESHASGTGKFLLWLAAIFLVLATALQIFYYVEFKPTGDGSREVEFTIQEGETWSEVMSGLQSDGLIKSAKFGDFLLKLEPDAQHYAGTYLLNDGMNTQEIIDYLSDPENQELQPIAFTIVPGTWAKDIASQLSQYFPFTQEEILEKWNDETYIEELAETYTWLNPEALSSSDLKVKLEGYLFPETYNLDQDMDIDGITRMFLDGFDTFYQENKDAIEASDYSLEQLLTMASIVQFEAGDETDMAAIAGVFYNRINADMNLESSVTVCYALYEEFSDATACETNYDIDSPYNTYLNAGLPPGPIDNPSAAAILAAITPDQNNYLYFAADINNVKDGKVYFSETYEEHLAICEELGLLYE